MEREERERFVEWWKEVEPRIIRVGRRMLGSQDAGRDLAQDLALVVLSRSSDFRDKSHFEAWLLTRARWLALDRLKLHRRTESLDYQAEASAEADQEQALAVSEILQLVSRLPAKQRLVFLRSLEGFSNSGIAAQLGISEATVRSHKRHARYWLASRLFTDL